MGYILNTNASGTCPHGGSAQPTVGSPRVKAGGAAVLTVSSQFTISGCSNTVPPGSPFPCVMAMFTMGATRVKAGGLPVLLEDSQSTNIPTGVPTTVINTQMRVKGQ